MNIENVFLSEILAYENNAKKHSAKQIESIAHSIAEFGFNSPILIDENNVIIAGHGRFYAAQKLDMKSVPCIRLAHLTENQKRAYIIADNRLSETGGGWEIELLKAELEQIDFALFEEFLIDDLDDVIKKSLENDSEFEFEPIDADCDDDKENLYTNKIVAPIYKPKGDNPPIELLIDRTKTNKLQAEIDAAGLPPDVARFLKDAAERHTVFHFGRIAEWYCHATPQVQDLMEKSGMVIIDFKKAIEYGFVHLTERLGELADLEEGGEDEG